MSHGFETCLAQSLSKAIQIAAKQAYATESVYRNRSFQVKALSAFYLFGLDSVYQTAPEPFSQSISVLFYVCSHQGDIRHTQKCGPSHMRFFPSPSSSSIFFGMT